MLGAADQPIGYQAPDAGFPMGGGEEVVARGRAAMGRQPPRLRQPEAEPHVEQADARAAYIHTHPPDVMEDRGRASNDPPRASPADTPEVFVDGWMDRTGADVPAPMPAAAATPQQILVEELTARIMANGRAWWRWVEQNTLRNMCHDRGLDPSGGTPDLACRLMSWDPTAVREPPTPRQLRSLMMLERMTGFRPQEDAYYDKRICSLQITQLNEIKNDQEQDEGPRRRRGTRK